MAVFVYEDPSGNLNSARSAAIAIRCRSNGEGRPYQFEVIRRDGSFEKAGSSRYEFTLDKATQDLQEFYNAVGPLVDTTYNPDAFPTIRRKLEAIGRSFYRELIPEPLKSTIADCASHGDTIDIHSNHHWIPWEILHDGEDFVGAKFKVRRRPVLPTDTSAKRRPNADTAIQGLPMTKRAIHVIGDKFLKDDNIVDADDVFALGQTIQRTIATERDVSAVNIEAPIMVHELARYLEQAQLAHFTCHGEWSGKQYYLRLGPSEEHHLDVVTASNLELNGTIVFVNACSSAGTTISLGEFQNMGWAFYQAGASTFIGTLVPVPRLYALQFAARFYRAWQVGQITCSDALYSVKHEMVNSPNPCWLFYCQYGVD